jgi:hypothetical protein
VHHFTNILPAAWEEIVVYCDRRMEKLQKWFGQNALLLMLMLNGGRYIDFRAVNIVHRKWFMYDVRSCKMRY